VLFLRLSVERSGISVSQQSKARERPRRAEHNYRPQELKVPRELIAILRLKRVVRKLAATSFAISDMCGDAKYIQQARSQP
jgi:hypothetical protein